MKFIDLKLVRAGWTAEQLETFMAGEWFSGMPVTPERLEEMRDELRRQLRERDEERGLSDFEYSIGRDHEPPLRISEIYLRGTTGPPAAASPRPWWRRFLDRFGATS